MVTQEELRKTAKTEAARSQRGFGAVTARAWNGLHY